MKFQIRCISFSLILIFFQTLHAAVDAEKIIGANDLIQVKEDASNIPFRYRSLVDAFGMLSMGCTATHIGRGIVLSAGHCFWAPPEAVENLSCADVSVAWGLRGQKTAYLVSKCEKIIMAQRSHLGDFAIIQVSPVPPVAIPPDVQRRAIIGDTLTLFSHPDAQPLFWSQLCGVERKLDPALPPNSIQHQCDTNPGSSGAAIINALSLKIVGIHDGGRVDEKGQGMNYGTFIMDSPMTQKLISLGF